MDDYENNLFGSSVKKKENGTLKSSLKGANTNHGAERKVKFSKNTDDDIEDDILNDILADTNERTKKSVSETEENVPKEENKIPQIKTFPKKTYLVKNQPRLCKKSKL